MFVSGFHCTVVFAVGVLGISPSQCKFVDGDQAPANKLLNMTIYYESECPACNAFFRNQLFPNYKYFQPYITLDFVPYGYGEYNVDDKGNYKFTCQHGPRECKQNKFQACAIDNLKSRPDVLSKYIICYMTSKQRNSAGQACAQRLGIDFNNISSCSSSKEGDQLLVEMSDRTDSAIDSNMKWVPTIVLNGVLKQVDSEKATENFGGLLCEKMPHIPVCN